MTKITSPLLLTAALLFFKPGYSAEKYQEVKAPITSVKVFLNAAQITHSKKIKVKPGHNKFAFLGLAMNIHKRNISLRNTGPAELLTLTLVKISDTTDIVSLDEGLLDMIGKAKDSLLSLEKNIAKLRYEILGLELERKMLVTNDDIIPNGKQINLMELKMTTEFYRERFRDVNIEIQNKKTELARLKKQKVKTLKSAFDVENEQEDGLDFSIITAELHNGGAEYSAEPELVYLARESGWIPVYEVFSSNNKSLKINYRAKILNSTGIDWNNQELTLSTADPFQYYAAPDLEPYYVSRYNRPNYNSNNEEEDDEKVQKTSTEDQEQIFTPDHEIVFKILKLYTIKTGTIPVMADVTVYDLTPEYLYRCAPKKEEQVYSIARIKDWEKLNLMDGEASIYNNGAFLGKAYIRPSEIEDYLELPTGIVTTLFVKYKLVSEYSSKKILAGQVVSTENYEIKIKNNGAEKITIEVLDQVPVSEESRVKTENVEMTEGGERDEVTGLITWKFELNPSSEKIITLKYSVTYPKRRGSYHNPRFMKSAYRAKF